MTWAAFKAWVEAAGVRDTDPLFFIDVCPMLWPHQPGCVSVCRDPEKGVYIVQGKGVPK